MKMFSAAAAAAGKTKWDRERERENRRSRQQAAGSTSSAFNQNILANGLGSWDADDDERHARDNVNYVAIRRETWNVQRALPDLSQMQPQPEG